MNISKQKRLSIDLPLTYVKLIIKKIPNYRFVAYGEYVRDRLLKLKPNNITLFTSAPIDLIVTILSQNIFSHKNLLLSRNSVTTTTKDNIGIVIEHSPLKLMKRRANTNGIFTINTILYDVKFNNFIRSTRSLTDLHNYSIKPSNDPEDVIKSQPTSMIDACGLLALNKNMQLGETVQTEIIKRVAVLDSHDRTQQLRIKMAILKIMEFEFPSRAFRSMHELGILKIILPELDSTVGVLQNRHHNIHYCPDCKNFFTLNEIDYKKWDTSTIGNDQYTKKILEQSRKE